METRVKMALRQQCKTLVGKDLEWWRRRESTRAPRPQAGGVELTTGLTPDERIEDGGGAGSRTRVRKHPPAKLYMLVPS